MVTRRMVLKFLQLLLFHRSARRSCQFEMNIGRNFLFKIIDCSAPFNSRNYLYETQAWWNILKTNIFSFEILYLSQRWILLIIMFSVKQIFFFGIYFSQKKNRDISILIKIEKLKFKSFDVWKFCFWFYYNAAREMIGNSIHLNILCN